VTRRSLFQSTPARALFAGVAVVACNAILDNEPGVRRNPPPPDDVRSSDDNEPQTHRRDPGIDGDAGANDDAGRPSPCAESQRMCHGYCVGLGDPHYGCGDPSCAPCTIAHGTPACENGACIIQTCDRGFADCDGDPANGCETDLSRAASCGACGAVCPPSRPVCAPAGGGFGCTTGCGPDAPLRCGDECVDPLTSINHCGDCDVRCPEVDNGIVECVGGRCELTCKPGYRACGSRCVVTTDPSACGPGCTVCPVPPNATAACQADRCAFLCDVGFGNCNQDPDDGCETRFADDPENCGGCGKSCNGGVCVDGECVAAAAEVGP